MAQIPNYPVGWWVVVGVRGEWGGGLLSGEAPWESATSNTAASQPFLEGNSSALGNTTTPRTVSFGKSLEEGRDGMLVRVNRVLIVTLQNVPRDLCYHPHRDNRERELQEVKSWAGSRRD